MIYALLTVDADLLRTYAPGGLVPEPLLYGEAVHQAHRQGHYHAATPGVKLNSIVELFNRWVTKRLENTMGISQERQG